MLAQSFATIMMSLILLLTSVVNVDVAGFYKDLFTSKSVDVSGIGVITSSPETYGELYEVMYDAEYTGDLYAPEEWLEAVREINYTYSLKADMKNLEDPKVDFSFSLQAGKFSLDHARLLLVNDTVYTDRKTIDSVLRTALQYAVVAEEEEYLIDGIGQIEGMVSEIFGDEKDYLSLYTITEDDKAQIARYMEREDLQEQYAVEMINIALEILENYKFDNITLEDGVLSVHMGIEDVFPEIDKVFDSYKSNRERNLKSLYKLYLKVYDDEFKYYQQEQQSNPPINIYYTTDIIDVVPRAYSPQTYEEFKEYAEVFENELHNIIKVFQGTKSGMTPDEEKAYKLFEKMKGSYVDYKTTFADDKYTFVTEVKQLFNDKELFTCNNTTFLGAGTVVVPEPTEKMTVTLDALERGIYEIDSY